MMPAKPDFNPRSISIASRAKTSPTPDTAKQRKQRPPLPSGEFCSEVGCYQTPHACGLCEHHLAVYRPKGRQLPATEKPS